MTLAVGTCTDVALVRFEPFLPRMRESVARGEPRWRRLLGGAALAVKHPELLLAEGYRRRLFGALRTRRKEEPL